MGTRCWAPDARPTSHLHAGMIFFSFEQRVLVACLRIYVLNGLGGQSGALSSFTNASALRC